MTRQRRHFPMSKWGSLAQRVIATSMTSCLVTISATMVCFAARHRPLLHPTMCDALMLVDTRATPRFMPIFAATRARSASHSSATRSSMPSYTQLPKILVSMFPSPNTHHHLHRGRVRLRPRRAARDARRRARPTQRPTQRACQRALSVCTSSSLQIAVLYSLSARALSRASSRDNSPLTCRLPGAWNILV